MKANKKFSFLAFLNASDSDVRSGLLVGCGLRRWGRGGLLGGGGGNCESSYNN